MRRFELYWPEKDAAVPNADVREKKQGQNGTTCISTLRTYAIAITPSPNAHTILKGGVHPHETLK